MIQSENQIGDMKTIKIQTDNYPTSKRRCVIDGKSFIVTRHFVGDKSLNAIMAEIAITRADREMSINGP